MLWEKLDNPKPGKEILPEDYVRCSAHAAAKNTRYIKIRIGKKAARLGSLTKENHKVHVLKGNETENGKIAICLDDAVGAFSAKRLKDETYLLTISAGAAAGRFSLEFEAFSNLATVVPNQNGPHYIIFPVAAEFLA